MLNSLVELLTYNPLGEYDIRLAIVGFIFGAAIYLVYQQAVWTQFGVLKSISISYYSVKPRWLFQMFMWGSILAILCIGQNVTYMLSGLMFFIMTCNPTINRGNIYFIPHMIGAISGTVIALFGIYTIGLPIATCTIFLCITAVTVVANAILTKDNKVYWIEQSSFIMLLIGFLLSIIDKLF